MFLSAESLILIAEQVFGDQTVGISSNSFQLSLGNQAATTTPSGEVGQYTENRSIVIKPGQLAYLLTKETIKIPNEYMAFISLETEMKFRGLDDVSGFHVSPGYDGKLVFAVSNESTKDIALQEGDQIFRMWVAKLDQPTSEPTKSKGLKKISSEILSDLADNRPNIFSVDERLSSLENKIDFYYSTAKWTALTIAAAIIAIFLTNLATSPDKEEADDTPSGETQSLDQDAAG